MVVPNSGYRPCERYGLGRGVCLLKDFLPPGCPDFLTPKLILLLLPADLIFAN